MNTQRGFGWGLYNFLDGAAHYLEVLLFEVAEVALGAFQHKRSVSAGAILEVPAFLALQNTGRSFNAAIFAGTAGTTVANRLRRLLDGDEWKVAR